MCFGRIDGGVGRAVDDRVRLHLTRERKNLVNICDVEHFVDMRKPRVGNICVDKAVFLISCEKLIDGDSKLPIAAGDDYVFHSD